MPTALGPFDICSSAFQPKEFPCAENNGKQDVTFRWEKGGIRQWRFMSPPASTHNPSMPPFCEWVIYKLLSSAFKAPSICPHHPLPCPVSHQPASCTLYSRETGWIRASQTLPRCLHSFAQTVPPAWNILPSASSRFRVYSSLKSSSRCGTSVSLC